MNIVHLSLMLQKMKIVGGWGVENRIVWCYTVSGGGGEERNTCYKIIKILFQNIMF